MKIIDLEGEVYQGTPVQIVSKMRNTFNRFNPKPVATNEEFMKAYIANMKFLKDSIACVGDTPEEKCASFVQSLLDTGQAKLMKDRER